MRALGLIIKREYLIRIKKKSFIILTVLMPFLFAALLFVPLWLAQIKDSESKRIIVIDKTGLYAGHLQSSDNYTFETSAQNTDQIRPEIGNSVFALVQITDNLSANPKAATIYSEKQVPMDLLMYLNSILNSVNKEDKLNQFASSNDIDKEYIRSIKQIVESRNDISINTIRWDSAGEEKKTSAELATTIGMILVLFMYMFILTYGAMVMQGVIEEKSNRIVEIMISSVRPFDLMMGKIIGIGLTGFTQLFIWIVMIGIIIGSKDIIFPAMGNVADTGGLLAIIDLLPTINWTNLLIFFILFFIGGYLIYAAIFAMFASAVDNPQDSQQFVMPITIIFIFALYAGIYSVNNPDGPLAFWCSMIPFTSPIVMMVRIPAEIPLWETLVSLAILFISVIITIKIAAKIYRVGILMYGKKPDLKELYKWMKYK